jgi:hypothetical protein
VFFRPSAVVDRRVIETDTPQHRQIAFSPDEGPRMPDALRRFFSRGDSGGPGHRRLPFAAFAAFLLAFAAPVAHAEPAGAGPAAQVLGTEIHTADAEELRFLVLRALTDRYATERNIAVEPAEIDTYVAHMAALAAKDRKERQARRDEIERQLAATTLGDAERTALSSERDALDQLLRDLGSTAATPQEAAEDAQVRRTIAAAFIRQWKLNQALYRDYGGRIIFQQGGPEPLDAYRRFLEEQQKQGAFAIADKALEAPFWRYYTNDAIHSFYPAGSAEEAKAFQNPWWLAE